MRKLLLSITLFWCAVSVLGQTGKTAVICGKRVNYQRLKNSSLTEFRFLILRNVIEGLPSERGREIRIFMDEKPVSEENLKTLFTFLSKKFRSPNSLEISVLTNPKDLPDMCNESGQSGEPEDPDDFHWAVFMRRENNELFRYNPILKKPDIKTIILKGREIINGD